MYSNEFWEIVYVYEGYGSIHTKENSEIIKAGSLVITKPHTEYAITSPSKKMIYLQDCAGLSLRKTILKKLNQNTITSFKLKTISCII